ncbi:hypothetical protein AAFP35_19035 [Gordonia sp. CPCC 206044]|uniref:hypothetical protein n=1 Tax=Gordonia sp. CPCC 206044 TaxID=3140793 RepID=UPI003AF3E750
MRRVVVGVLVIVGVMSGVAGGVGAADAAPRPSVRVCAVYDGGRPYVGPMKLYSRKRLVKMLNTSPRGCMVFEGLYGGFAYRASVESQYNTCTTEKVFPNDPNSTMTRTTGQIVTRVGKSAWKVTPRSNGRLNLGRIVVNTVVSSC